MKNNENWQLSLLIKSPVCFYSWYTPVYQQPQEAEINLIKCSWREMNSETDETILNPTGFNHYGP